MSKETVYPSQINTKTISCRISSLDYVSFLQDALSKGITLNDWLLVKIYGQNDSKSQINDSKSQINGKEQSTLDVLEFPFTIEDNNSQEYNFYDFNDIEDFVISTQNKIDELIVINNNMHREWKISTDHHMANIDLNKKPDRGVVFGKIIEYIDQIEWESSQDKKEVKRDLKKIFNDLFENII